MNFSKLDRFRKVLVVVLAIALVFVAGVITDRYVIGSLGLAKSETVSEFGGMEGASYIIFKEGLAYYAKNGKTGAIDYSGTNAAQIIQNAINALHGGGKIFIKVGTYSISSTIEIYYDGIHISGESGGREGKTVFDTPTGTTCFKIGDGSVAIRSIIIENLKITHPDETARGLDISGVWNSWFRNLYIYGFSRAVYVDAGDDVGAFWNTFENIEIRSANIGYYFSNKSGYTWTPNANTIRGGVIDTNEGRGVSIERADTILIDGVGFSYNYRAIHINWRSNGVVNCRFEGNTQDIYFTSDGDYNRVIGNSFGHLPSHGTIVNNGNGNEFKCNNGFITENTIYFSDLSNGSYVEHGLAGAPTTVVVTLELTNGYAWAGHKNSTHVRLWFSVSTASGYMYVEYKP